MTISLPSKQNDISHDVFADFAATGECDRLLRGLCPKRCVDANGNPQPLEQDHIIPKAHGGSNDTANLRLLCRHQNQTKSDRPDPYYEATNGFFDQRLNEEFLRDNQREKGSNLVATTYHDLFAEMPDNLFRVFMVVAWMVGAGKTVGTLGILLKINQVRRERYPTGWRIRRVLWLVHQRTLVDSIAQELKTEPAQYGVVDAAPHVETVSKPSDWILNWDADIVVACPQAIWDTKGRALDANTLRRHLGGFDAIIVDEGQFAVDRYIDLLNLAPKALKFSVTATPFDANRVFFSQMNGGIYQDRFRLFSVSGYEPGTGVFKRVEPVFLLTEQQQQQLDGRDESDAIARMVEQAQQSDNPAANLPRLNSDFYEAIAGEGQIRACGIDLIPEDDPRNADVAFNGVRNSAVVQRCIALAKRCSVKYGYDVHVMIRTGSIPDVIRLTEVYSGDEAIAEHGKDFAATCVYAGSKGVSLGSPEHPWMLAKRSNGRAQKGSKRLLFVVDIGQFGINQPACAVIGWIDVVLSIIEIVQRLGRAVRERDAMGGAVHVVWDDDQDRDGRFRIALYKAVDYIRNMEEYVSAAFIPLDELSDVEDISTARVVAPSISKPQKAEIAEVIGAALLDNPFLTAQEAFDAVVEKVYGGKEPRDEAKQQMNELIAAIAQNETDEGLHDRFFNIPQCFRPFNYVVREEAARRVITRDDILFEIARSTNLRESLKDAEVAAYDAGDPEVVQHWQAIAKAQRDLEFQIPKSKVHPHQILGVVQRPRNWPKGVELPPDKKNMDNNYAHRLRIVFSRALDQAAERAALSGSKTKREIRDSMQRSLNRAIIQSLYIAAARLLNLPDFKEETIAPVKDHISHMLCAPSVTQAILGNAQGLILQRLEQELPGMNRIFAAQVAAIGSGELEYV